MAPHTRFSFLQRAASLAVIAAVLLLFSPAAAWWGKGHMTISQIALRHLKNPKNKIKLQAMVDAMHKLGPYQEYDTCVDVAMWADDLKSIGLYTMSSWHFVNYIYNPSNYTVFSKEQGDFMFANSTLAEVLAAKRNPISTVNVENLIPMLMDSIVEMAPYRNATGTATLTDGATATSTNVPVMYSEILVSSLSNLIHYIGDIHQPLHSTALFSEEMPRGDQGGNKIQVKFWNTPDNQPSDDPTAVPESMRLHYFWDSIAEGPQDDPARPLNAANAKAILDFAINLENQYQFTDSAKNELNSSVYAAESFAAARDYVYNFGSGQSNTNTSGGVFLDAEYVRNARVVAQQRVALAGYRLAAVLDHVLADVTVQDIENGLDNVRARLTSELGITPGTVNNFYTQERDVSGGTAAAIVMGCFVLGCLVGGFLTVLSCFCCCWDKCGDTSAERKNKKKKPADDGV